MAKRIKKSNWIYILTILAFTISVLFSLISETIIPRVDIFIGIIVTLIILFIGILFDMIGVAVTQGNEATFNSMISKRIPGSKIALKLIKNKDKVSSFCNDVIGDICGIICGSTGAVIVIKIINSTNLSQILVTVITMALISTITISGKAIAKVRAIKNSTNIILRFSKVLCIFGGKDE